MPFSAHIVCPCIWFQLITHVTVYILTDIYNNILLPLASLITHFYSELFSIQGPVTPPPHKPTRLPSSLPQRVINRRRFPSLTTHETNRALPTAFPTPLSPYPAASGARRSSWDACESLVRRSRGPGFPRHSDEEIPKRCPNAHFIHLASHSLPLPRDGLFLAFGYRAFDLHRFAH